jgi:hypothetical protein
MVARIRRMKVPKVREPVAPDDAGGVVLGRKSFSYALQTPSPHIAVRRHMEGPPEAAQEMERAQASDLRKDRDAERSVRKVLFDVRRDALQPSPVQLAMTLRRKPATEARRENMPVQVPYELVVLEAGAFVERAQARSYTSSNSPDDRIGTAVQVFEFGRLRHTHFFRNRASDLRARDDLHDVGRFVNDMPVNGLGPGDLDTARFHVALRTLPIDRGEASKMRIEGQADAGRRRHGNVATFAAVRQPGVLDCPGCAYALDDVRAQAVALFAHRGIVRRQGHRGARNCSVASASSAAARRLLIFRRAHRQPRSATQET